MYAARAAAVRPFQDCVVPVQFDEAAYGANEGGRVGFEVGVVVGGGGRVGGCG